ncbi:hypothetical protein Cgig2_011468 [Carnegiea gigantea]|uniref:Homeobox domain-containing protein n=1 Tax=Carnegiea gigantea TaxID=171969 RepID=A0A9Q1KUG1_9CARY|nr:hypothetical protein Cgig2_011468 [Carnegiea gigantea]
MENELHMQLDHSSLAPIVSNEIPPHQALSELVLQSTFFQLNPQVQSMIGLPMFSSVQGEPFKNLIMENNGLNDDLQQGIPSEPLSTVFLGNCSYDYSSSIPTSLNCGFDGLLCDVNDKWDQNKFLTQPELNCGTSTSGFEPIQFSDNQNANDWVLPNSMNVGSSYLYETPSSDSQGEVRSLDLATCRTSQSQPMSVVERCSPGSNRMSLGLASNSKSSKFSTIISGSRYLGVLRQILSGIPSFSLENIDQRSYSTSLASSDHFVDPKIPFDGGDELLEEDGSFEARAESSYRRLERESKKSQLLTLLQMVDDCYNQCLYEIHSVTSALHSASELDPQIHASFALQTVSLCYKNLRERISNQILAMGVDSGSLRDKEKCLEKSFIQKQWALQQLKKRDQQLWRPQRGLPERSVSVLRAWMFDNFLHPYPKDSEKHLLAIKSGLTRSQVSNWFINARVRLWKPLVEEMSAELNRRKGCCQNEEGTNSNGNNNQSQLSIFHGYDQRFSKRTSQC